ncbi:MAG: ABC transporter substrate-binding protein [Pseudooceanicola sp.]|nr:ABC transporter substrate-binding protein [Pseudooceanicola sp.]
MTQTRPAAAVRAAEPVQRLLAWGLMLVTAVALAGAARAEEKVIKTHGYSFYGELTYPADFAHFNYVNPDAPKGGEISISRLGTFDSMNPYAVKGRGGYLSTIMYESLLSEPADTYDEGYGLLAESLEYDEGKNWVIFHMRPEAKFSDGTPVTAHDVKFSHELLLEQGLPSYRAGVSARMKGVEVIDDHTIKFSFVEGISRRSLIDQVGGVPVWSKKWYEESGARLDESRLETSPGSGPYMIETVNVNRRIVYKRNPDYWGKDLPINKGRNNFDRIRVEYFGDDTVAFEAFKAGDYTFRIEGDSKKWASNYNFPKIADGQVIRTELPDGTPATATGIVFNLRRDIMKDKRLREAVALAYNFEWTNESLQYGLFKQRTSYSQDTPIMAEGPPEGAELEFLKSLGDLVPPDMLSEPARMPHTSDASRLSDRRNLRSAMKLLDEAGWPVGNDGKRRNDKGELLSLTFLFDKSNEGTLSAVMENFVANLETMGITANLEKVDSAQYTLRERENDYDLVFDFYRPFLGTGTGLAQMYGTPADGGDSLFNPAGLASPLIDRIIDASLRAESLEEEQATLRALDRALRYEFIMIPVWYKPAYWLAYYDQYDHPEPLPPYDLGYLDFWWYDQAKAEALRAAGALR